MELKGKKIGVAFCGSFCTFDKVFGEIELLAKDGAKIYPIFSDAAKSIESRFGKPEEFLKRAEEISGHKPIMKIASGAYRARGISGYIGDYSLHGKYSGQTGQWDYGYAGIDGGQGAS